MAKAKRKPITHKEAVYSLEYEGAWRWAACGLHLFKRNVIIRKTWRGVTCKNCLRCKPKKGR